MNSWFKGGQKKQMNTHLVTMEQKNAIEKHDKTCNPTLMMKTEASDER